eukprot:COSAG02_NODE_18278_length_949_cov_0.749412_1_plen_57_part_00
MPCVRPRPEEVTAEEAFKALDTDGDGKITGGEFRGIRSSGLFHLPELPVRASPRMY